jgi:quercetin dioxygenase-like cupin family protein
MLELKFKTPPEVFMALEQSAARPIMCLVCEPEEFERRAVALAQLIPKMECLEVRDTPTEHRFSDGVYIRVMECPENCIVVGHLHTTEHENFVLEGSATVIINGQRVDVQAGDIIKSNKNIRKVAFAHQKMRWATVHPNPDNERNIEILEARTLDKKAAEAVYEDEISLIGRLFKMDQERKAL